MTDREDLLQWLLGLPLGVGVAVDDGGLMLVADEKIGESIGGDGYAYEVGGVRNEVADGEAMDAGPSFTSVQFRHHLNMHIDSMHRLIDAYMQYDGDVEATSQRVTVLNALAKLTHAINGIESSDVVPGAPEPAWVYFGDKQPALGQHITVEWAEPYQGELDCEWNGPDCADWVSPVRPVKWKPRI